MAVLYRSTRDNSGNVLTASQAVLQGLSRDGGLYVPTELPKLDFDLSQISDFTYQELAYRVLKGFFDDYTEEQLRLCISQAYDDSFTNPKITPISYHAGNAYLELYHGPTIAFKDVALQLLPHLMTTATNINNEDKEIVILTATSGDTGKAAMAGFADVDKTQIIVFYPKDGVSVVQQLQMTTQEGKNVHVVAIEGNFDDAQTNVKKIFNDSQFNKKLEAKGYRLSSANSINIGRLFPQVVYYFYAYGQLVKNKKIKLYDKVNFSVPTGNFGDILAGYYAKKLGLPINKLICASNENNVLTDFFSTGTYNRLRDFVVTTSPAMDILVSSNLERLLYYVSGEDADKTRKYMDDLQQKGQYTITDEMKKKLDETFVAGCASEEETSQEINRIYQGDKTVIDPHTAVASYVAHQYQLTQKDDIFTVIVATADPYKFPQAVVPALTNQCSLNGLDAIRQLQAEIQRPLPYTVEKLFTAPVLHRKECLPNQMEQVVDDILQ